MAWRLWVARFASITLALGGVSLAAAPTASAATCPSLSGASAPYTVSPAASAGVDWSNCNLSGANLFLANLNSADLTGANLTGADLFAADLTGADLTGANLTGADLGRTDLTSADLRDAFVSCGTGGTLGTVIYGTPINLPSGWVLSISGTLTVPIIACPVAVSDSPIVMWWQSYGRVSQGDVCDAGWTPSYAKWPNAGTGGWVCNRLIRAHG